MCQNIAYGQDGEYAISSLVQLHVTKNSFDNVHYLPVDLGCRINCSTPPEAILGETLQSKYKSWQCEDESCAGITFIIENFCQRILPDCAVDTNKLNRTYFPDNIYVFKVNNRSTRKRCEIC